MLATLFIYSPCIACFIMGVLMLFIRDKNQAITALICLTWVCAAYFFVDANYVTYHADYTPMVYMDVMGQFLTLCLPSIILLYLQKESGTISVMLVVYLLFIFPILILVTDITLYYQMGIERAVEHITAYDATQGHPVGYDDSIYRLHRFVCMGLYNVLLLIVLVIVSTYIGVLLRRNNARLRDLTAFFFCKRRTISLNVICSLLIIILLICCLRISLGRTWLLTHPGWSAAISGLMCLVMIALGYVSVLYDHCMVSFADLLHPRRRFECAIDAQGFDELLARMDAYLTEDSNYKTHGLKIDQVAEALGCERFRLSTALAQCYAMSFNDYLRHLRVSEAQKLIVQDPDASLESIAANSGFASVSDFHNAFLKVVGIPPRLYSNSYLAGTRK